MTVILLHSGSRSSTVLSAFARCTLRDSIWALKQGDRRPPASQAPGSFILVVTSAAVILLAAAGFAVVPGASTSYWFTNRCGGHDYASTPMRVLARPIYADIWSSARVPGAAGASFLPMGRGERATTSQAAGGRAGERPQAGYVTRTISSARRCAPAGFDRTEPRASAGRDHQRTLARTFPGQSPIGRQIRRQFPGWDRRRRRHRWQDQYPPSCSSSRRCGAGKCVDRCPDMLTNGARGLR